MTKAKLPASAVAKRRLAAKTVQQETRIIRQTATFTGPVPPPNILNGYNAVVPGAAERIIAMAERQQKHDHETQRLIIKSHHRDYKRGQYCAVGVSISVVIVGGVVAVMGQPAAGAAIGAIALGPVISAFVHHQRNDSSDNDEAKTK